MLYRHLTAVALSVLSFWGLTSCNAQLDESIPTVVGRSLKVTAEKQAIRSVISDGAPAWTLSDAVYVFDSEGGRHLSLKSDACGGMSHTFNFENWPDGLQPVWCLSNDSAKGTPWADATVSGGSATARIPEIQKITLPDSYAYYASVSAGPVQPSLMGDGTYVAELKDLCGYIRFNLSEQENIRYITIRGSNGENLSGCISTPAVDSGIDDPEVTVTEGVDSIRVWVAQKAASPSGSFFIKDDSIPVHYYVSIVPGITFKPVITFTDLQGRRTVKKSRGTISTSCGNVVELADIDSGISFDPIPYVPDTVTFVLGAKWNFRESAVAAASQTGDGETYTYPYSDPAHSYSADFPFVLCKGDPTHTDNKYYYKSNAYTSFYGGDNTNAYIKLPAVPGRAIRNISFKINGTGTRRYKLTTAPKEGIVLYSSPNANSDSVFFNGPEQAMTETGTSYYILMEKPNTAQFVELIIIYTDPYEE